MSLIGYARVSTTDQDLGVQLDKLRDCDKIYQEKLSGTKSDRPELQKCLDYVREGDTLVCSRLDRLARSTLHLCQIAELLEQKKVSLKVLDQAIDTSTPTGRLLFHMLAAISEFETEIRRERQAEGIKRARAEGVKLGSVHRLNDSQVVELKAKRESGLKIKELMAEYNLSKATIYRRVSASQKVY